LPAAVEASVPVATPLAFVVPTGCVKVFPAVGVAASVTVAPSIGLPVASRAVTRVVGDPPPAAVGGVAATEDGDAQPAAALRVAATSDRPARGGAALPVAVKMTGLPVSPDETAVSVFVSAFVPSVHEVTVAMPLALVVTGVVGTTVPLPAAAANVTDTPATG